jgi:hypothetical protein
MPSPPPALSATPIAPPKRRQPVNEGIFTGYKKGIDTDANADRHRAPLQADLVPYANNTPALTRPSKVQQIAASIREFGFTNPVLISSDNIIAGYGPRARGRSPFSGRGCSV